MVTAVPLTGEGIPNPESTSLAASIPVILNGAKPALCRFCAVMRRSQKGWWWGIGGERYRKFRHHTYFGLQESAVAGCQLCQIFFDRLLPSNSGEDYEPRIMGEGNDNGIYIEDPNSVKEEAYQWGSFGNRKPVLARFKYYRSRNAYCYEGKHCYLDISGRDIHPDPLSPLCIDVLEQWILDCQDSHSLCRLQSPTQLQSRVIYVSTHPHDGPLPLLATESFSIEARKSGIAVDTLPKTFQDAIAVTRKLGVRYLWIDSLCIMQDSPDDWRAESNKMCGYYRNAYLTISAMEAAGGHEGFLHQRDFPRVKFSTQESVEDINLFFRPQVTGALSDIFKGAKTDSRAWCLQERLLSTRILHYTKNEMLWECMTCVRREGKADIDDSKPYPRIGAINEMRDVRYKRILNNLSPELYPSHRVFEAWYNIIEEYSSRLLTKNSDKLAAIAGVAASVKSTTNLRYVSGLWEEDNVRGLLWHRNNQYTNSQPHIHGFPSWSWASSPYPVTWKAALHTYASESSDSWSYIASVQNLDAIAPDLSIPLPEIVVKGKCKTLRCSYPDSESHPLSDYGVGFYGDEWNVKTYSYHSEAGSGGVLLDDEDGTPFGTGSLDLTREERPEICKSVAIAQRSNYKFKDLADIPSEFMITWEEQKELWGNPTRPAWSRDQSTQSRSMEGVTSWSYLVLLFVPDVEGTWRRIGIGSTLPKWVKYMETVKLTACEGCASEKLRII